MAEGLTIYITQTRALCASEWQLGFVKKLQLAITKTIKKEVNYIYKCKEQSLDELKKQIAKADVFVVILDNDKNTDEAYLNELYAISDAVQANGRANIPIYKINLDQEEKINQPALFQSLNSYDFFESVGRKVKPYEVDSGNLQKNSKAWNLILDLTFDLKDSISKQLSNVVENTIPEKKVYLGSCPLSLLPYRDELKRELQHFGYEVFPHTKPNMQKLSNGWEKNFENCKLIIQLLGDKYGDIERGERISVYDKENELIKTYIEGDSELEISRYVWMPDFFKRVEQRQVSFSNKIKQNEASEKTRILECSFDELKTTIFPKDVNKNQEHSNITSTNEVYVISSDATLLPELTNEAEAMGVKLVTMDFTVPATLYKQHIELLKTCKHALIQWSNNDNFWLKSKLSDLVKAPGMGRKGAFDSITLAYNNQAPSTVGFVGFLSKLQVLDINNPEALRKYFQSIVD